MIIFNFHFISILILKVLAGFIIGVYAHKLIVRGVFGVFVMHKYIELRDKPYFFILLSLIIAFLYVLDYYLLEYLYLNQMTSNTNVVCNSTNNPSPNIS